MKTAAFSNSKIDLRPGMREIQAGWSPQERRARAIEGRRRMQELFRMVERASTDPEIWAVGALADDDLQRLVG
jgi:hypothetical protein